MRFINRRRCAVGVAMVGLVVATTPAISGASELGSTEVITTYAPAAASVAESIELPGGAVALRTTTGSVALGPVGTHFDTRTVSGAPMFGVVAPDPGFVAPAEVSGWTDTVINSFFDAVESGASLHDAAVSVEPARLAVIAASPSDPVDEGYSYTCNLDGGNNHVAARQCIKRRAGTDDGTHRYVANGSYTWADPQQGEVYLQHILDLIQHNKDEIAVDWHPMLSVQQGSCGSYTTSVSGGGTSVSYSQAVCPDIMTPTMLRIGVDMFFKDWYGRRFGAAVSEGTDLVQGPTAVPQPLFFGASISYGKTCTFNETICRILAGG